MVYMNERIEQLAHECYQAPEFDYKKFAELIVRECCNKIERKYKYALGEKTQWAMSQDVQDLLKEHFGVEQ